MFSLSRSDEINYNTLFIFYLLYNAWILPLSGARILEGNIKNAMSDRRLQETEQVPFNGKPLKYYTDKQNMETWYPLSKRYRNVHTESPKNTLDLDFIDILVAKDEDDDRDKRFDDYGHMRFGKRGRGGEGHFDDYGHMRFGRSS